MWASDMAEFLGVHARRSVADRGEDGADRAAPQRRERERERERVERAERTSNSTDGPGPLRRGRAMARARGRVAPTGWARLAEGERGQERTRASWD
jgi:hypothetical protein